jgi:hypothetical protein
MQRSRAKIDGTPGKFESEWLRESRDSGEQ